MYIHVRKYMCAHVRIYHVCVCASKHSIMYVCVSANIPSCMCVCQQTFHAEYSQSHLGWHVRKLFHSSKLKARTFLFTETWQKRRSSFQLWASKELSKMLPQVSSAVQPKNDRSLLQKSPIKETIFCYPKCHRLYSRSVSRHLCVPDLCTTISRLLQIIGLFCRILSLL